MLKITPQNNSIEFQLKVENASLQKTSTRLIVEVNNTNTIIPLLIDKDGTCKGDIPLNEAWDGKKGKIKIEVIAEGSYFEPFNKEVEFEKIPKTPKASIQEIKLQKSTTKSSTGYKEPKIINKTSSTNKTVIPTRTKIEESKNFITKSEKDRIVSEIVDFFKAKKN